MKGRRGRPRKVDLSDPEYRVSRVDPLAEGLSQGLDQEVVLRLLSSKNRPEKRDRVKYEQTQWFSQLKEASIKYFGSCVLCEACRNSDFELKLKKLTIHHRNYRHWFDESMATDVTVLCHRCHGSYHRSHRR